MPTRANTLSFSNNGQPIPSFNRPAVVFERLFGLKGDSIEAQRKGLTRTGSHLDLLLDEAKSLHRKLGKNDQDKLDQYLTSVREIEQDVERSARWLDMPKPKVNAEGLTLDADNETPGKLIYAMLDLIALSFQTDSTRFVTYQLASMHGAISIANKFPSLLGFFPLLPRCSFPFFCARHCFGPLVVWWCCCRWWRLWFSLVMPAILA